MIRLRLITKLLLIWVSLGLANNDCWGMSEVKFLAATDGGINDNVGCNPFCIFGAPVANICLGIARKAVKNKGIYFSEILMSLCW